MLIDGERLKALLSGAQQSALLCAPFIKVNALDVILKAIPRGVQLRVVTRWRAEEVACGVTDLEVFDLLKDREVTELHLLEDLHAKIYVADHRCLVGSSNITAAALGWANKPNIEFMTETIVQNPDVARLITRLDAAIPATYQIKSDIAERAKAFEIARLFDEVPLAAADVKVAARPWLPRCAAPDHLFAVYSNANSTAVTSGTLEDASDDLRDLSVPPALSKSEFNGFVAASLEEFPAFRRFLDRVAGKLTDIDALVIVSQLRPDLVDTDARKQWQIVRDWIRVFFADRYEVAPESFVVRLRS